MNVKKTLLLLCLGFMINGFMVIMTGTLLTYLMSDCGLSMSQAGLLASIQAAGNLIAGMLSGFLIGKIGRKYASVLYCLMFSLGFSVLLYSKNVLLIYICIFISGLGWGLCNNVCHLIINSSEKMSGNIYFMHSSYAVGAFIGPMVLGAMLKFNAGWKSTVWLVLIFSIILAVLFMFANVPDDESREKDKRKESDMSFLGSGRYYVCFFLYFCYGGVETCINSWLITFLSEKGLMELSTAQMMLSMLWLVIIFGRLLQVFLQKWFAARTLLLAQSAMMLVCLTVMAFTGSGMVAAVLVFIIGIFMAGITPANALNAKEFMHGSGVSSGIIFAGNGLGSTIIPYIVGLLFEHVSLTAGMCSVSAVLVLFTVMAVVNNVMVRRARD